MKMQDILDKLYTMGNEYVAERIWEDPNRLADFMAEYAAYYSILLSNYGDFMEKYRQRVASVMTEEQDLATQINEQVEKPSERRTQSEIDRRVDIRISNMKAMRDKFEYKVEASKALVSTMQSKRRAFSDEAKGII